MTELLLVHAGATWALVGLIWTIQVVHYPLLRRVAPASFVDYHAAHMRLMTFVVAPLMLTELGTAAVLVWSPPHPGAVATTRVGAALVLVVWLSTALLQVPQHRALAGGFDGDVHRRLVRTNWLRTAAWTARGVVALALLAHVR